MILICPSCDARYAVDAAKFPAAGRTVRCAKCSHSWHQVPVEPEPVIEEPPLPAPPPPPPPEPEPQIEIQHRFVEEEYPANPSPIRSFAPAAAAPERQPLLPKLAVVLGWVALIAIVLLIALSAVRYRQHIAAIWPQSAGVYSSLGLPTSTNGIDFRQVDYRRENQDGQVVLAVSGQIVNNGARELPVPQIIRVTLSDVNNHELYHWTFKPTAITLKPGQSAPFITRLSSPPAAARHLEVRFAKDAS